MSYVGWATSSPTSATTRPPPASSSTWRPSGTRVPSCPRPAKWRRTSRSSSSSRPHRRGGQGGRLAPGLLTGSDEVLAARLPARWRAAGGQHRRPLRDGETLARQQPQPKDPDLTIVTNAERPACWPTRRPGSGRNGRLTDLPSPPWPPTNTVRCRRQLEPQRTRSTSSATTPPERICQGAGDRGRRPGRGRHAGDPDPAGDDRSHGDGRGAGALRAHPRQAGAGVVDGRPWTWRRARPSFDAPASPPSSTRTRPSQMFNYLWRSTEDLRRLYETPVLPAPGTRHGPRTGNERHPRARAEGARS